MRWDDVWLAVAAAFEADPDISGVMGDAIYLTGERDFEVPSLTALLIVDTEDERFTPIDMQFDLYTRTMEDLATAERAMRRILTHDVRIEIGGVRMWSEFQAGRAFFGPAPDRYFRRSLDFRFTPIRSRYVRTAES